MKLIACCNHFHYYRKGIAKSLLIMKMISIFMIAFSLTAGAKSYSQKISLSLKNAPIEKVFKEISRQSGFTFFYTESLLKKAKKVTVAISDVTLDEALKECFKDQVLTFSIVNQMIVIKEKGAIPAIQQTAVIPPPVAISGKVTNDKGEPLVGATITEKGTKNSTATKEDGSFSINVAGETSVLIISYVGYEPEEHAVRNKINFSVAMKASTTSMSDIVVVGYGTQRKTEVTGSVASVKAASFTQGNVVDAGQLIMGKIAGLAIISPNGDPTGSTQILLRGQTTLMGANQNPLVLIDGIPGDMKTVAPQDIESIDVLKDGAAAAIYGTRGTNGVILITTKRASGNNRSAVEYSSFISTQTIARKLNLSNATDFRAQMAAGFRTTQMADHGASTDWLGEISRKPVIHNHNLTFRGGTAVTNYLINLNYNNGEGIFKKSFNQVFSGRADFNHSMLDNKLKINLNVFSSSRKWNGFNGNVYRQATLQNPTAPVKNPDGTWFQELTKFEYQSPVSDLMESDGLSNELLTRYKGAVVYSPVKGLKLSSVFSYAKRMYENGYAETKQHVSTLRDGRNGYASVAGNESIDRLAELTAEYSKTIDRHNFTVLGGYSYQESEFNSHSMQNWDFPTDRFSWNNIGIGQAISSGDFQGLINSYKNTTNLIGFFGRLNYNYDQKYLLMASFRKEQASQLWGTKNPWGVFPAVSAGWRITKESFMQGQRLFDDLKIRAGYGITGSQPSDLFRGVAVVGYGGFVLSNGSWIQTLTPTQNANENLKWEEKRETNIGVDFSMLGNRISGSVDYYNRQIHNLLFLYDVPSPPNLYNQTLANVGTMENKGIEVLLNFVPIRTKNFEWNSTVTYSNNSNKLVSLSNDIYKTSTDYLQVGAIFPPIQTFSHLLTVGGPVGDFYGFKVVGIGDDPTDVANFGQWIYEGSDGKPVKYSSFSHSFGDKKVIGNGLPKFYAAWNNNFKLKNWDLNITQRGAFGFQIANLQRMMLENPTQSQYNVLTTAYDKIYGKTQLKSPVEFNSYYIEKGDYWKIDNITLGYNFNKIKSKYIQSARLYASALNAFIITGYKGIDPEISLRNGTSVAQSGVAQTPTAGLDPGVDGPWKYPTTRTFSVGLNVTF